MTISMQSRTLRPENRLFKDVTDNEWEQAYGLLLGMRAQFPAYRDDELLMHLLIDQRKKYLEAQL